MKISETVTDIVSLLGGPQFNAEDIDWASDLPPGRRLLEWLVSQVQADDGTDMSDSLRAGLHAISLEDAELKMLRATRKATTSTVVTQLQSNVEYIPPWRLRAKEEYMGAEAALLETETVVLKARLHQTKVASQSLSHAIKFIASEIENTEKDILAAENNLAELSLKADAAILVSVTSSLGLLDEVVPNCESSPTESLSVASSIRTAVSDRFESQMRAIDAAESRLPAPSKLRAECARLDTALNTPRASGESLFAATSNAAFNREVARLCETLEDPGTGAEALAAVLSRDSERSKRSSAIDVHAELQCAWALDQAAILDAREGALDKAIVAFSDTLLPPLTALHDDLAATNSAMREAQALAGALAGEIQDIVQDLRAAQEPTGVSGAAEDDALQAGLTSLLKQLKDLRPRNAPPLVLLTQEDILGELRSVYEREAASRCQEEAWTTDLLPALRSLEAAHAPLLNVAYAHSPMNTSPPFALPADVQSVQTDAKTKADDLGDAIAQLQEVHF
ncbi:hypothetical protein B0H17DRAFT_1216283 [Mycena rosella]|uniref:Uncharacterized protein n=1 Tax=Mycena rosella TaxID=1033263 RepID=A0AAD7FU19_MYCRO|nr:hypothetical protein B0H17DRAFT_1216283 [Mycena rosella]